MRKMKRMRKTKKTKKIDEDIESFFEWFAEQCRKYGGKVNEETHTYAGGEDIEKVLECIFPESGSYLNTTVYGFTEKNWVLSICIGTFSNCKRVSNLDRVSAFNDVFVNPQLRGSVYFSGFRERESELDFVFGESELRGVRLRSSNFDRRIFVEFI